MTDSSNTRSTRTRIRWSWRVAVVGLGMAVVSFLLASLGPEPFQPLYWVGIAVALVGLVGSAVFGAQDSNARYGIGVLAAVVGVLVLAFGVENGIVPVAAGGALLIIAGAIGVVTDTRRPEQE